MSKTMHETYLAIVFYRPGHSNEAIGLLELPTGQLLTSRDVTRSIADFMSQRNISTSQFSGIFPGHLKGPADDRHKEQLVYTWDHPKLRCSLPMQGNELTQFSAEIDLPIIVFTMERQAEPVEHLRINC
jgi:hypothetical protein